MERYYGSAVPDVPELRPILQVFVQDEDCVTRKRTTTGYVGFKLANLSRFSKVCSSDGRWSAIQSIFAVRGYCAFDEAFGTAG
jgi:hypothetical protein